MNNFAEGMAAWLFIWLFLIFFFLIRTVKRHWRVVIPVVLVAVAYHFLARIL
jgi:hypothetical protein